MSVSPRFPSSCIRTGSLLKAKTVGAAPPPASLPSWLNGVPVGGWVEISGTALSSVAPSPTPAGSTGPSAKTDAWTSFAIDTRTSKVYSAANGGHGDYAGNEVDALDLSVNSPAWSQLRAPTASGSVVSNSAYYSDGRPSARHTYYGVFCCEQNDEILIFGGNMYGASGTLTDDVAAFDLTTGDWKADGTRPNMPAGTTSLEGHPTVIDPSTGDVYVLSNEMVNKWTRSSNTWSEVVSQYNGPYGYQGMSAFDSSRNRVLVIGGLADNVRLYTLSGNAMSTPTLTGSGASISTQDGAAMCYVPAIDKYLVRLSGSGGTVYQVDASTWDVSTFSTTSGASVPAATNGPYNKFLYVPNLSGCVYVPSYSGNVWFLRVH